MVKELDDLHAINIDIHGAELYLSHDKWGKKTKYTRMRR